MSSSVRSEKKNGRPKSSVLLLCAVVRLAADVVDVDVAQAGGGGVGHLRVVVDGDIAVEDLLEEVFIVGNGEVLHGPGSGRHMEPPQAKTISVPLEYQPETMVCSSGEAWKEAPYSQE